MRRKRLLDGDNNKVTLKGSRDLLALFSMGIFEAAHGWGGRGKKVPSSLKSVTHILQ